MKSYSLREAWQFIDDNFGEIKNVYDSYVLKEDWMKPIDDIELLNELTEDLLTIERVCGVASLRDKQNLLYDKLAILELPVFGYKYSVPIDIDNEIKLKIRETKKEITEIEEKIEDLLDRVEVDPEILHLKNWLENLCGYWYNI